MKKLPTVVLCAALFCQSFLFAEAQGTTFTYQGRFYDGATVANGKYDLRFALFNAASSGAQQGSALTNSATTVSNGLFTATLDFGNQFSGANRWLEISVRTNGGGSFISLAPRQALTPTPYAITAGTVTGVVPSTSLAGTYPSAVTFNHVGNSFSGSGAGLTALNASQLANGAVPSAALSNAWKLVGNSGTTPDTHFLGTTDNQPLELKVNGLRALRIENNGDSASDIGTTPDGAPNLIAGSPRNFVGAGVVGATIAGGGATNHNGIAFTNSVLGDFSVVGGGLQNTIAANSQYTTIAGGGFNDIGTYSSYSAIGGGRDCNIAANTDYATIAGGYRNDIGTNSSYSAIGGGFYNNIAGNSHYATIAGGLYNDIERSSFSTIGGGRDNTIAAYSQYATIPGGENNAVTSYAFAAGRKAKAIHEGSFVWGDSFDGDVASSDTNQFTVRASGGVRFFSNTALSAGVSLASGGTAWAVISDRNLKKEFNAVNSVAILEKLAAMPITQWNYQWETPDVPPHIGPMAQDFKAAFYPGSDDKSITTQEADGVALAAIQGLNQKLEAGTRQKDAEIAELKRELANLKEIVGELAGLGNDRERRQQ